MSDKFTMTKEQAEEMYKNRDKINSGRVPYDYELLPKVLYEAIQELKSEIERLKR